MDGKHFYLALFLCAAFRLSFQQIPVGPNPHVLNCECGVSQKTSRIVGGSMATPNEFPWLASIRLLGNIHCSGTIISNRYILTAGHCLYSYTLTDIDIVLGAYDLRFLANETVKLPEAFLIHEYYWRAEIHDYHDIALIRVKGIIEFTPEILPVCLPPEGSDPSGRLATIAGWGRVSEDGSPSDVMLKAQVETMSREVCLQRSAYLPRQIGADSFCAARLGIDSCSGDSGGPLMRQIGPNKMEQLGIISWGIGCADNKYPGVYVKVSFYARWIYARTRDSLFCSK